jgi:nucleoid DNA-binding protein
LELVHHIRDLLYHHDCVVVPGFGGFVTNERSARIDSAANCFYPPSRAVGFNARLDHNDGLLISYLSARLSMNYVDVKKLVEKFAGEVIDRLADGKVVHFEGIGEFTVDRDHNLHFDPDPSANFLKESYGLSFFRFPALAAGDLAGSLQKGVDKRGGYRLHDRAKKLLRYAAIGIPLIAALSWGAVNTGLIRDFSFELFSLNPFSAVVDSGFRSLPPVDDQKALPDSPVAAELEEMSSQRRALMYREPGDAGMADTARPEEPSATAVADEPGAPEPGRDDPAGFRADVPGDRPSVRGQASIRRHQENISSLPEASKAGRTP